MPRRFNFRATEDTLPNMVKFVSRLPAERGLEPGVPQWGYGACYDGKHIQGRKGVRQDALEGRVRRSEFLLVGQEEGCEAPSWKAIAEKVNDALQRWTSDHLRIVVGIRGG